jgi:hypothetical protein
MVLFLFLFLFFKSLQVARSNLSSHLASFSHQKKCCFTCYALQFQNCLSCHTLCTCMEKHIKWTNHAKNGIHNFTILVIGPKTIVTTSLEMIYCWQSLWMMKCTWIIHLNDEVYMNHTFEWWSVCESYRGLLSFFSLGLATYYLDELTIS